MGGGAGGAVGGSESCGKDRASVGLCEPVSGFAVPYPSKAGSCPPGPPGRGSGCSTHTLQHLECGSVDKSVGSAPHATGQKTRAWTGELLSGAGVPEEAVFSSAWTSGSRSSRSGGRRHCQRRAQPMKGWRREVTNVWTQSLWQRMVRGNTLFVQLLRLPRKRPCPGEDPPPLPRMAQD